MGKITGIPFDKGHAASCKNGFDPVTDISFLNIPAGYAWMRNCFYGENEVLKPAPRVQNQGTTVPYGIIQDVFPGTSSNLFAICKPNEYSTTGKLYYSENAGVSWTEVQWCGEKNSPSLPAGKYSSAIYSEKYVVFKSEIQTEPTYIIDTSVTPMRWDYIITGSTDGVSNYLKTAGSCVCVHEYRVIVGGNNKNEGDRNWIRYSGTENERYNPRTGYVDNYCPVGSSDEEILYMFDNRGGLVVIKSHSVWEKNTYDSEGILEYQFSPTLTGLSQILDAAMFDGNIFILTLDGLLFYNGSNTVNITQRIFGEWDYNQNLLNHEWKLGYWRREKMLMLSDNTDSMVYCFDMVKNRWMVDADKRSKFCTVTNQGYCVFSDGTNQLQRMVDGDIRNGGQDLWTPFYDLGSPHSLKHFNRLMLNYSKIGTVRIRVYASKMTGATAELIYDSSTGSTTIEDGTVYLDSTKEWREISVRLTCSSGSNSFVLKSIVIDYEEIRE